MFWLLLQAALVVALPAPDAGAADAVKTRVRYLREETARLLPVDDAGLREEVAERAAACGARLGGWRVGPGEVRDGLRMRRLQVEVLSPGVGSAACLGAALISMERIISLDRLDAASGPSGARATVSFRAWGLERPPALPPASLHRAEAEIRTTMAALAEMSAHERAQRALVPALLAIERAAPEQAHVELIAGRLRVAGAVRSEAARAALAALKPSPDLTNLVVTSPPPAIDSASLPEWPAPPNEVVTQAPPVTIHAVDASGEAVRAALAPFDRPYLAVSRSPVRVTGRARAATARGAVLALIGAYPALAGESPRTGPGEKVSLELIAVDAAALYALLGRVNGIDYVVPGRPSPITVAGAEIPSAELADGVARCLGRTIHRRGGLAFVLPAGVKPPEVADTPGERLRFEVEDVRATDARELLAAVSNVPARDLPGRVSLRLLRSTPAEIEAAITAAAAEPPATRPRPAGAVAGVVPEVRPPAALIRVGDGTAEVLRRRADLPARDVAAGRPALGRMRLAATLIGPGLAIAIFEDRAGRWHIVRVRPPLTIGPDRVVENRFTVGLDGERQIQRVAHPLRAAAH